MAASMSVVPFLEPVSLTQLLKCAERLIRLLSVSGKEGVCFGYAQDGQLILGGSAEPRRAKTHPGATTRVGKQTKELSVLRLKWAVDLDIVFDDVFPTKLRAAVAIQHEFPGPLVE